MEFASNLFQTHSFSNSVKEKAMALMSEVVIHSKPTAPDLLPAWVERAKKLYSDISILI